MTYPCNICPKRCLREIKTKTGETITKVLCWNTDIELTLYRRMLISILGCDWFDWYLKMLTKKATA